MCASVCQCVLARLQGVLMLDSVLAAADLSSSPFVWIGRERVQSLLRWAGPCSPKIQTGRQRGITPPIASSVFAITIAIV